MPVGRPTLLLLLLAAPVAGQPVTRLANDEPEIRLDARGRNGVCDVLLFTPDGGTLLAAGEDKTVHRWAVGPKGLTPAGPPLTWNTLRERRGSIYALALDPKHGRVAVGGFGKKDADVSVLDLHGKGVADAVDYPPGPGGRSAHAAQAVWALAYNPAGTELLAGDDAGNVWRWATAGGRPAELVVTGGTTRATLASRVVWVGYLNGKPAYANRDGKVYAAGSPKPLHDWGKAVGRYADRVVASGDGTALAARPYQGDKDNGVEVWWPGTGAVKTVTAPAGLFPARTALDAAGRRLAVGYIDRSTPSTGFAFDRPGEVRVYDLTAAAPKEVARSPRLPACPDQIAFHPARPLLATADHADHGTSLWELDGNALKPVHTAPSDTPPLWAVGLSKDGRYLSTKTDRDPTPDHPNRMADGKSAWVSFDLSADRRGWAAAPHPPVPPADTLNGWRVEFDRGGSGRAADEANWAVVGHGQRYELKRDLHWNQEVDDLPRCYTFLRHPTDAQTTRLAVGHLWGLSVYDLHAGRPPVRVRKLVGHAGYVTAVAPTADQLGLVSAGRDNAVAVWNLADFPQQGLLGAKFREENGKLVVAADPDPGSPADECGLVRGDVVTKLYAGPDGERPRTDWQRELENPRPDRELAFYIDRPAARWPEPRGTKTKLLHRPVAKFVPLRGREWVLYTYRQCYYDSSANGDHGIQWLVSKDRPDTPPDVFPVDQFRPALHKPDRVTEVLARQRREPAKPVLVDKYPPAVEVEPAARQVAGNANLRVTVWVTPRNNHLGRPNPVELVELWAGDDTRVGAKPMPAARPGADGTPFALGQRVRVEFDVPADALSDGENILQGAALSRDGGWGAASRPAAVQYTAPADRGRRLFVVSAGIGKYQFGADVVFPDLESHADATRLRATLDQLAGVGGFAGLGLTRLLVNEAVTREGVLKAVAEVAMQARGDDLFVLALSGHGILGDRTGKLRGLEGRGNKQADPDTWYFAIPQAADGSKLTTRKDFGTPALVRQTFLSDDDLFQAVSAVRCRKLLVIDCCHSGKVAQAGAAARPGAAPVGGDAPAVTKNADGALRRNGFGPVVLTACAANEKAIEHPETGAVFTTALIAALTPDKGAGRFSPADADRNGRLTAGELAAYLARVVTEEAAKLRSEEGPSHPQHAQATPALLELARLVVAEKKSGPNPPNDVGSDR